MLGYHGCDRAVADRLIERKPFRRSRNDYDWLGHGIYFWEANPDRALSFIKEVKKRSGESDKDVAVVGAPIDLGYCLDLLSERSLGLVRDAHDGFKQVIETAREVMPRNFGGTDLLRRNLDCAVINYLHQTRKEDGKAAFQTVRGVFVEGNPVYPTSGFRYKTHIQICVRRSANIKGIFKVA